MTKHELDEFISGIISMRKSASDEAALNSIYVYPTWKQGTYYTEGTRLRYGDSLFKVRLAHTSEFPPSINTAALYTEISLSSGDRDHPYEYNNNMELKSGFYYMQNDVLYICTRDTGIPVFNDLVDLVGIYVDIV